MAVSITQQPTSPNSAYTDLIYVVSGSGTTGNPQYSYIMDVYLSGSSNLIYRSLQVPNGDNAGVFNPSNIFQGEISLKTDLFTGSLPYFDTLSHKTFDVKFGEAYGTSISSSITYYPNLTSSSIAVWPSTVDPYSGDYNFPSQSYDPAYIENVLNGAGAFCITSRNFEPWSPDIGVGDIEFTIRPVTSDD